MFYCMQPCAQCVCSAFGGQKRVLATLALDFTEPESSAGVRGALNPEHTRKG